MDNDLHGLRPGDILAGGVMPAEIIVQNGNHSINIGEFEFLRIKAGSAPLEMKISARMA